MASTLFKCIIIGKSQGEVIDEKLDGKKLYILFLFCYIIILSAAACRISNAFQCDLGRDVLTGDGYAGCCCLVVVLKEKSIASNDVEIGKCGSNIVEHRHME